MHKQLVSGTASVTAADGKVTFDSTGDNRNVAAISRDEKNNTYRIRMKAALGPGGMFGHTGRMPICVISDANGFDAANINALSKVSVCWWSDSGDLRFCYWYWKDDVVNHCCWDFQEKAWSDDPAICLTLDKTKAYYFEIEKTTTDYWLRCWDNQMLLLGEASIPIANVSWKNTGDMLVSGDPYSFNWQGLMYLYFCEGSF